MALAETDRIMYEIDGGGDCLIVELLVGITNKGYIEIDAGRVIELLFVG